MSRGFKREEDSMRFGVRINSNIISELRRRDININNVIRKGFEDSIGDIDKVSTGIFGKFDTKEQVEKYNGLKNRRAVIELILLKRLLEK